MTKTYGGFPLVPGKGMKAGKYDDLVEREARVDWPRKGEPCFIVVPDVIDEPGGLDPLIVFEDKDAALAVAKANSNGNMRHRVLIVTDQIVVASTDESRPPPKAKRR
jgi:hypothetical protein